MGQGMSLSELSEASGLSERHLSSLENGQSMMGLRTLGALSSALGLQPLCFLLFPRDDEQDRIIDELRRLSPEDVREVVEPLLQQRSQSRADARARGGHRLLASIR